MDNSQKAFSLASHAAQIDFHAAVMGLMQGHSAKIKQLEAELSRKDAALLASLALSRKGARSGANDELAAVVCKGLEGAETASPIEKAFLENCEKEST